LQNLNSEGEELEAVSEVLHFGMLAQGLRVADFEETFADYLGSEYAVAVNSGTAALHCALLAHGIRKGDEVIKTPLSFVVSGNSILHTGARPVLQTSRPKHTLSIQKKIQEKLSPKKKLSCQAHGAEY
jgi:perosamine synthetase